MRSIRFVAPLAALAIVATACGGGTITIDGKEANDHGRKDVSGQDETEFELDDFYFGPTVLVGTPGQTITLEAQNEGDNAHTFTIEGGDVDEEIQPGKSATIEVTFPDSGTLTFECRFHEERGMRGGLEVES